MGGKKLTAYFFNAVFVSPERNNYQSAQKLMRVGCCHSSHLLQFAALWGFSNESLRTKIAAISSWLLVDWETLAAACGTAWQREWKHINPSEQGLSKPHENPLSQKWEGSSSNVFQMAEHGLILNFVTQVIWYSFFHFGVWGFLCFL